MTSLVPRKKINHSHNTPDPRNARTPEVRQGLGQIVGEVAVALRRFNKAILDALMAKATSHFQAELYKVCM